MHAGALDTMQWPSDSASWHVQSFFSMWWEEQSEATQQLVRQLVKRGQLSFVNGGCVTIHAFPYHLQKELSFRSHLKLQSTCEHEITACKQRWQGLLVAFAKHRYVQHDEAAAHFVAMIDQTTIGHQFLNATFGVTPRIGWQIDPFGHSSTQASLMSGALGFDALYFGRADYQARLPLLPSFRTAKCRDMYRTCGRVLHFVDGTITKMGRCLCAHACSPAHGLRDCGLQHA